MRLKIAHLSTAYHTALVLSGAGWREGLDLEWRLFPTGPAMIKAIKEGSVDIAYIGLPPAMIGISKGMQIKCVAGGHVEGTLLLGRKEHSTLDKRGMGKVLRQFRGGVIGAPSAGSIHDVIIRDLLLKNSLEGKVEVRNYAWSDQIVVALEEKEVDAAVGTPSMAGVVLEGGIGKVLVPPSRLWPYNPSYGIVVREDLIIHHPQLIESFLRLHRKASRLIRESPEEAARIVAEVLDVVDKEFVLRVMRMSPRYCTSLPRRFIETALAFVPVLKRLGYINGELEKEDVFYTKFIKKIHPEGPHY